MWITLPPFRHCVYIAQGPDAEPIYVGVTSNLFARLGAHASSEWWHKAKSFSVESFPTRDEADARELELIRALQTEHNVWDNPRKLLEKAQVSVEEVRAFIDAHPECMPPPLPPVVAQPKPPRSPRAKPIRKLTPLPAAPKPAPEIPPGLTTLREFVGRNGVGYTLPALRLHANRYPTDFPACQGLGEKNAKFYRIDDLYGWLAAHPPTLTRTKRGRNR